MKIFEKNIELDPYYQGIPGEFLINSISVYSFQVKFNGKTVSESILVPT
jgi:hypothetical protein